MSITSALFGVSTAHDNGNEEHITNNDIIEDESQHDTENDAQIPQKTKQKGEKRSRSSKDSNDDDDQEPQETDLFATNIATKADLFDIAPVPKKETRREKRLRVEQENREQAETGLDAKTKKKLTPHEILKKKHLSHAVDKHEEEDERTVFVGNLPNTIDKKKVSNFFKDCGKIENARVRCQVLEKSNQVREDGQTDKSRGRAVRVLRKEFKSEEEYSSCAYILFEDSSAVEKACAKSGMVFCDRHITVTAEDRLAKAFDPKTSAYLGNIAYTTSDEQVWRFFIDNGINDVKRVRLIRDRDSGRAKGFGYVEFATARSLTNGINLRGGMVNGRDVRICHVQRSKDPTLAKLQASRREKRKQMTKQMKKHGPEGVARLQKLNRQQQQNGQKKPSSSVDEHPSWMGTTVNPRKKLPRDLRSLVPSGEVITKEKKKAMARKATAAPFKRTAGHTRPVANTKPRMGYQREK